MHAFARTSVLLLLKRTTQPRPSSDFRNRFNQKSEVSEEDSAQRERHLKNMRDRIVSAKRAGREEEASKVASESAAAAERGERAALPRTGGISTSSSANKHSSPASGAATQGAP